MKLFKNSGQHNEYISAITFYPEKDGKKNVVQIDIQYQLGIRQLAGRLLEHFSDVLNVKTIQSGRVDYIVFALESQDDLAAMLEELHTFKYGARVVMYEREVTAARDALLS